jgi:hypothetical protein
MSRLDELPPDQHAVLSLLLRQRKSYAEVALLLGIAERAVHDRAHAALAVLAPREARGLEPERRDEVGDYLLGQAGVAERIRTRTSLGESEQARIWAQAIAAELTPLTGSNLPEIPPAAAPAVVPEPARTPAPSMSHPDAGTRPIPVSEVAASLPPSEPAAPSSRLGGALLLAAIVVAVVVAVVLITSGGGGSHSKKTTTTSTTASKASPTDTQFPLHSPSPNSRTVGVVAILSEKGKHAFFIEAQHLPPSHGFFYAIWLYNSHTSAEALSRAPAVGSSRKLEGGAALPTNAAGFREILLTRETSTHPTKPGHVVLRGTFNLGG